MNDNLLTARRIAEEASVGYIESIKHLSQGYTSHAYTINTTNGTFVLLIPKQGTASPPNYAYHFAILKALEEIDYPHAPRAVYLPEDKNAIIITHEPGEKLTWVYGASETEKHQAIKLILTALVDLQKLSFDICAERYYKITGTVLEAETPQTRITRYFSDWLQLAEKGKPDARLLAWAQEKAEAYKKFADSVAPGDRSIISHGDTTANNVLLTRDMTLHFIDWDTSGFRQFPDGWNDYGVGYLMNHIELFSENEALVFSLLTDLTGTSEGDLRAVVRRKSELVKLADINWAIMMHARVEAGEIVGDPDTFHSMAIERTGQYKLLFAQDSFLDIRSEL